MFKAHWLSGWLPMIAVSALIVAWPTGADAGADGDTKEINAYRLTDAGLARYTQATQNLARLEKPTPAECAADEDDSGNGTSIDQLVASIDSNAKVRSAIQAAGMTTREYIVFGMTVFQAGMAAWALDQPGGKLPPGLGMDNVTFYRKHGAAMKQLSEDRKAVDCDDAAEDEA